MNRSLSTDEKSTLDGEGMVRQERPIQTQVKEFFASDQGNYLAEWGIRVTDRALIFHFYPPKGAEGWEVVFDMPERLKIAIDQVFDVDRVSCGFVPEEASFWVIAGGYGRGLDPRPLAERFLNRIDEISFAES